MDELTFWTAASGVGTLATAIVSLFLLGQGQRDRRRIREDQVRAQADLVTMSYDSSLRLIRVHNNSDRPMHFLGVDFVAAPISEVSALPVLEAVSQRPMGNGVVLPGKPDGVVVPRAHTPEICISGDFAIVNFLDAHGTKWRRRSDTLELARLEDGSSLNVLQRSVQFLARLAPETVSNTVHGWVSQWAHRTAKHRPNRVPFAVRLTVQIWGYWPPGSPDSWLLNPDGNVAWAYIHSNNANMKGNYAMQSEDTSLGEVYVKEGDPGAGERPSASGEANSGKKRNWRKFLLVIGIAAVAGLVSWLIAANQWFGVTPLIMNFTGAVFVAWGSSLGAARHYDIQSKKIQEVEFSLISVGAAFIAGASLAMMALPA